MTPFRRPPLAAAWRLCAGLWALAALAIRAETPEPRVFFALPAGDAATRLRQLSEIARREILFAAEAVRGVQTHALHGEFTALEAAHRLLAGTPLAAMQDEKTGALAVRPRSLAPRPGPATPATPIAAATSIRPASLLATLQGRVSNQVTGDALEGARVAVAGTDRVTHTERGGLFSLPHLPAGNVIIQLSYPGLDPATFPVHLDDGAPATREFPLTSGIYRMDSFAVTAMREGNAAALARQEQALTLTHAFATDAFGNIARATSAPSSSACPAWSANTAAPRSTPSSCGDCRRSSRRVMMDGTRAARRIPTRVRSSSALLPAGAIQSVEVIKTPTADMDADSLGGVVNLRTRSGFDRTGRTVILNAATSHNDTMGRHLDPSRGGKHLFPQVSAEYSDVFELLGRKLGFVVTGTYQEVGDGLQTIRAEFAPNWDYAGPTLAAAGGLCRPGVSPEPARGPACKFDYQLGRDSSVTVAAGSRGSRTSWSQSGPSTSTTW
jgi:iron complex outermembrane receptor protein